jgi:hypothetical protein
LYTRFHIVTALEKNRGVPKIDDGFSGWFAHVEIERHSAAQKKRRYDDEDQNERKGWWTRKPQSEWAGCQDSGEGWFRGLQPQSESDAAPVGTPPSGTADSRAIPARSKLYFALTES